MQPLILIQFCQPIWYYTFWHTDETASVQELNLTLCLSCLARRRDMVFSPFTLCQQKLRIPQHFMVVLSKTLSKTCSWWKHIVNSWLWLDKPDHHRSISCSSLVNSVRFLIPTVLQKSSLLYDILNSFQNCMSQPYLLDQIVKASWKNMKKWWEDFEN